MLRISPNPVYQILDQNGVDEILSINNDSSISIGQASAPVTTPGHNGYVPCVSRVLVTSAQLLALKTTPLNIIPAPATGFMNMVEQFIFRYTFGGTAYTLNAGNLEVFYGPSANAKNLVGDQSALLTQGANSTSVGVPALGVATLTDAQSLAQPIVLANTGTANYTLGNGTLEVVTIFSIVQV